MGGYYNHRGGDKSRNLHMLQQAGQSYMSEAVPPKYMPDMIMNPKKSGNQDSYNTFSGGGGKSNNEGGKKGNGGSSNFNHRSGGANNFYPPNISGSSTGPMPNFSNAYAPVSAPKQDRKAAQASGATSGGMQKSSVPQHGMGFPSFSLASSGPGYSGSYPEQYFPLDEKQSAKVSEKARAPTENTAELNTDLGSSAIQQSAMNKKSDKEKGYFTSGRRGDGGAGNGRFEHSSKKDKYPKQKKRRNDPGLYEEYDSPENEEGGSNFDAYNKQGNNSSSNNNKRYNDKGEKKEFKRDEKTAELDIKRAAISQSLKGVEVFNYDVSESVRCV
jgi:hypothetical protein